MTTWFPIYSICSFAPHTRYQNIHPIRVNCKHVGMRIAYMFYYVLFTLNTQLYDN